MFSETVMKSLFISTPEIAIQIGKLFFLIKITKVAGVKASCHWIKYDRLVLI